MKAQAGAKRNGSRGIGQLLRRYRKEHDQGVALLVNALLTFPKGFNSWEALARVLATAFNAAGIESKYITADNLRETAERNWTPTTGEQVKRV
jgi:hypothetical protein